MQSHAHVLASDVHMLDSIRCIGFSYVLEVVPQTAQTTLAQPPRPLAMKNGSQPQGPLGSQGSLAAARPAAALGPQAGSGPGPGGPTSGPGWSGLRATAPAPGADPRSSLGPAGPGTHAWSGPRGGAPPAAPATQPRGPALGTQPRVPAPGAQAHGLPQPRPGWPGPLPQR